MHIETKRVFIDIDALLDVRMAVLFRLYPDVFPDILLKGYFTRVSDFFSLLDARVDDDVYRKAYTARSKVDLKNARLTGLIYILNDILTKTFKTNIEDPLKENLVLEIGVGRYDFTDTEKKELSDMVKFWLPLQVDVRAVDHSDTDLTMELLRDNYPLSIVYDFQSWIDVNADAMLLCKLPSTTLMVPALCTNKPNVDNAAEIKSVVEGVAFADMEKSMIPIISLNMVDAKFFSVLDPKKILRHKPTETT